MTRLSNILDVGLLEKHIADRMVSVQKHPRLPLAIFNYTQQAQFAGIWGDGTIDLCRGLITDSDGVVVARPFKKFHNLNTANIPETLTENLPAWPPESITEKMDGSLGILWQYKGESGIATRGSFTSPQAQWATKWYENNLAGVASIWPENCTPLFEIIYDDNRIVVKYDFEGLIAIGLINNENGHEADHHVITQWASWNRITTTKKIESSLPELLKRNEPNHEGFVLTFKNGLKVKIKMEEYCQLHKIVTGMNARSVWERLSSGQGIDDLEHMPEHFTRWLHAWETALRGEYCAIYDEAYEFFRKRPMPCDEYEDGKLTHSYRSVFAEYVRQSRKEIHGLLFALLDNRMIDPLIWKMIKPRGDDRSFRTEGE